MKVNLAPGLINEGSNYTTRVAQRIDLDDAISFTTGVTTDADLYSIQRDAAGPDHLQLNVPADRGFKFSIAATEELIWTTGAFAFQQATTLSTTTGALTIDGDDGIALQTTGSGNVTVAENLVLTDNSAVSLGTGVDSRIYYDGTDTFWDLQAVGSGSLLIGLAGSFPSPDGTGVHIWDGTAGSVTANAGIDTLVLETSEANLGMSLLATNSTNQFIAFGAPQGNLDGFIRYSQSNREFAFGALGATQVLIDEKGITVNTVAGVIVSRSTTDPTSAISLFNGTAPVGTLFN